MIFTGYIFVGIFLILQGYGTCGMNQHVSYFEYLTYNVRNLHEQHERSRRSASPFGRPIDLQFDSHGRSFHLRLVRDNTIFQPNLIAEGTHGESIDVDLTHIYHGTLYGKKNSVVHGSIIDGIFRGVIYDPDRGRYYVEENTNFFGGSMGQSPISGYRGHSVLYHEDTVKFPKRYSNHEHCGASKPEIHEKMIKFQNSSQPEAYSDIPLSRARRDVDDSLSTCLLYIQTDHVLYAAYNSREVIISKIAEHVKAANEIYKNTEFVTSTGQKIRGINFKVQRLRVNDSTAANDLTNPFRGSNIGVEKFLDIVSLDNHNSYCLAYVFTNRDFDNGVLGLAWVGSASGTSGGVCETYKRYSDGSGKSLNTGIVTFKNYGSIMPARVTHITFAHELGHNFGSPHDMGIDCTPGESSSSTLKRQGNYIMFPRATSGNDPNNNIFSPCSIRNISKVLEAKKDSCFVTSDQPICGNQIVDDESEVCDCGYADTCNEVGDTCCTPADDPNVERRCKLKAGARCSISQGPCCNIATCQLHADDYVCSNESECKFQQTCNSSMTNSASCPTPALVGNGTKKCLNDTQVCFKGDCTGSICLSHPALEECACTIPAGSKDRSTLCHTCCQMKGQPSTCKSTGDPFYSDEFKNVTIFLKPGSACEDYNGYCDVFSKCRLVDADGPLSRLKKAIFNPELYSTIRNWIIKYWWAVALMALALLLLMAGFIKVCSVHTPSNNPRLPKHKQLPGAGTLQRRRARQQQQEPRSRRRNQRETSFR